MDAPTMKDLQDLRTRQDHEVRELRAHIFVRKLNIGHRRRDITPRHTDAWAALDREMIETDLSGSEQLLALLVRQKHELQTIRTDGVSVSHEDYELIRSGITYHESQITKLRAKLARTEE